MTLQAWPLRLPLRKNPAKPMIKYLPRRQPRITR
jgi:hypothetical protein